MAFGIAYNVILPLRLVNEEIIWMPLQNPFPFSCETSVLVSMARFLLKHHTPYDSIIRSNLTEWGSSLLILLILMVIWWSNYHMDFGQESTLFKWNSIIFWTVLKYLETKLAVTFNSRLLCVTVTLNTIWDTE